MTKVKSKWLVVAVLATALLAACGGGSDISAGSGQAPPAANPSTSAQGVVEFLLALIGNDTSDLSEPFATDSIVFATEELAEASPL